MDIRITDPLEYEASKTLWKECFFDGDGFIDWYYRTRSKPEHVLGAFVRGELVSMLHMRPVVMRIGGEARRISFVAGVCTKPRERRRGICGELFKAAFPIMEERGSEAAVLQPFRTSFYERFGFETFIRRQEITLSYDGPKPPYGGTGTAVCPYDAEKAAELYRGFTDGFEGASFRNAEYFRGLFEEFSLPGSRLVMTEDGLCAGCVSEEDASLFIAQELFFKKGADPRALLPAGFSRCVFPLPKGFPVPGGGVSVLRDFSMIRPLGGRKLVPEAPAYGFDMY